MCTSYHRFWVGVVIAVMKQKCYYMVTLLFSDLLISDILILMGL